MAIVAGLALAGCASSEGPQVLEIAPDEYLHAFDAAVETAREHGMPPLLRDPRAGTIETDSRVAGSLLEPWRTDNASFEQAAENTLTYQRRRARFQFTPAGFRPDLQTVTSTTAQEPLSGPDTLGMETGSADDALPDLTAHEGPLELRVWVYLERASTPGVRRDTWTRSKTTTAELVVPEQERGVPAGTTWTPVNRDLEYERRLLAEVQRRLAEARPDPAHGGGEGGGEGEPASETPVQSRAAAR